MKLLHDNKLRLKSVKLSHDFGDVKGRNVLVALWPFCLIPIILIQRRTCLMLIQPFFVSNNCRHSLRMEFVVFKWHSMEGRRLFAVDKLIEYYFPYLLY